MKVFSRLLRGWLLPRRAGVVAGPPSVSARSEEAYIDHLTQPSYFLSAGLQPASQRAAWASHEPQGREYRPIEGLIDSLPPKATWDDVRKVREAKSGFIMSEARIRDWLQEHGCIDPVDTTISYRFGPDNGEEGEYEVILIKRPGMYNGKFCIPPHPRRASFRMSRNDGHNYFHSAMEEAMTKISMTRLPLDIDFSAEDVNAAASAKLRYGGPEFAEDGVDTPEVSEQERRAAKD